MVNLYAFIWLYICTLKIAMEQEILYQHSLLPLKELSLYHRSESPSLMNYPGGMTSFYFKVYETFRIYLINNAVNLHWIICRELVNHLTILVSDWIAFLCCPVALWISVVFSNIRRWVKIVLSNLAFHIL